MNHTLVAQFIWKGLPVCFRICCWHNTAKIWCCPCSLIIRLIRERQDSASEFWQWVGVRTQVAEYVRGRHPSCSLLMPDRTSIERHNGKLQSDFYCPKKKKMNRGSAVTPSGLFLSVKGSHVPKELQVERALYHQLEVWILRASEQLLNALAVWPLSVCPSAEVCITSLG